MLFKYFNLKKVLSINFAVFFSVILLEFGFHKKVLSEDVNNYPDVEYIKSIPDNNFYILGPGDVLLIQINEFTDDFNNILSISGEGFIKLKSLNKIYVAGLTIQELTKILNKEFQSFVKEPDVDITVVKYRPVKIYIDGEVEETGFQILPGSFTLNENTNYSGSSLSNELANSIFQNNKLLNSDINNLKNSSTSESVFFPTVFDAIRKSNGITLNADLSSVRIIRKNSLSNGGGSISTYVNLLDTINQKDNSQNIRLLDGDNIYIAKSEEYSTNQITKAIKSNLNPKFINVFLGGRVENSGVIKLNKTAVLTDALEIVGAKFLKGPVRFLRYNSDGSIDSRKFGFRRNAKRGSYKNPILKDGDIIYISKSPLNVTTEVISEITGPFQGILSSYTLYKAFSDL